MAQKEAAATERGVRRQNIMTRREYIEQMKADIAQHVAENGYIYDGMSREELEEHLNDNLWDCDQVTGNGSGSYTFDKAQAKKNVEGAEDIIREMAEEFVCKEAAFDKWLDQDWEWFDVSIRCYLLGEAIAEYLAENKPNYEE